MSTQIEATTEDLIRDLYAVDGKAEIVNGKIFRYPPTGHVQAHAEIEMFASLRAHSKKISGTHRRAMMCCVAFLCDLPHRKCFCPDVSYYTGKPSGMKFPPEPPVFAVEVRSENDYGRRAEEAMASKRDDYFAAGTLVVWDVDLLSDTPVKSYIASEPDKPKVFRRGDIADAEPAVSGWTFAVDDLFA